MRDGSPSPFEPHMVNQLIDSIEYQSDKGRLSLQTASYLLVRPSLLVEIQKSLETHLPYDAPTILAAAAQTDGVTLASRFKEVFSYPPEQVLGSIAFMLAETGWGAARLEMFQPEMRELVWKVLDSPFADEYGPTSNPVCFYLLGLFQGAGMALFDSEVDGQEVQCVARGDTACRFVITARS